MPIQFEPLKKWYGEQLWTEYMNEQNENVDLLNEKLELLETSESIRDANEIARETAEGIRDTNELAREAAEEIREGNEDDRKAAELLRESAESDRETAYGLAEEARDGLYETAEGDRDSAYGLAENARDSLYSTAEGSRNTDYGLAETARGSSYTSAEGLRTTAFNTAQSDRATAFNSAQSDRATAFSTAESARTTTFNTAEDTRNSNEVTRIANENARIVYEDYNPAKDYVVGNKVAYQGSSYRNKAPCKGIVPTNTTYWLLIAAKGDTGDINNLTASHIQSALGFLPKNYVAGTNVQINGTTNAISATDTKYTAGTNVSISGTTISATDTKTTINGKTGAIAKADITALGIPAQDTVYDDTEVQQALAGLSDRLDNVKANDLAARREILDIKLKLDEMQIIDYLNKTGIGFYDLFTSLDHVDTTDTTASVDVGENHVVFSGNKELAMLPQVFDQLASIELSIYDKDREKIDVTANSSTNSVEILVEPSGVAIGDRFAYGDKMFTVTNIS